MLHNLLLTSTKVCAAAAVSKNRKKETVNAFFFFARDTDALRTGTRFVTAEVRERKRRYSRGVSRDRYCCCYCCVWETLRRQRGGVEEKQQRKARGTENERAEKRFDSQACMEERLTAAATTIKSSVRRQKDQLKTGNVIHDRPLFRHCKEEEKKKKELLCLF